MSGWDRIKRKIEFSLKDLRTLTSKNVSDTLKSVGC